MELNKSWDFVQFLNEGLAKLSGKERKINRNGLPLRQIRRLDLFRSGELRLIDAEETVFTTQLKQHPFTEQEWNVIERWVHFNRPWEAAVVHAIGKEGLAMYWRTIDDLMNWYGSRKIRNASVSGFNGKIAIKNYWDIHGRAIVMGIVDELRAAGYPDSAPRLRASKRAHLDKLARTYKHITGQEFQRLLFPIRAKPGNWVIREA